MGDLIESIFGGGRPRNPSQLGPMPAAPPGFPGDMLPPTGSVPGFAGGMFGGVGQGPMEEWQGFGRGRPAADFNADPLPVPGGDVQGEDITVQGRYPFKPKKRSLLGLIGDAILLHSNHKGPFFTDRVDRKNMKKAMADFVNNPEGAIRNVATFNPELAWKMMGQYRDDERADRTQDSLIGSRQEKVLNSLSGLAGAVYQDGSNYHVIRDRWNNTVRRNNIPDVAMLPEEFDPDLMKSIYMGGMTPNQQEMNDLRRLREQRQQAQGDRRLDQADTRIGIQRENVDSQIESRGVRDEVARGNLAVRQQQAAAKGGAAAGTGGRQVKTKYGLGEVDPSGKYMRVTGPDGHLYIYRSTGPDKWTFFKKAN